MVIHVVITCCSNNVFKGLYRHDLSRLTNRAWNRCPGAFKMNTVTENYWFIHVAATVMTASCGILFSVAELI